jgi:hypothetical protein
MIVAVEIELNLWKAGQKFKKPVGMLDVAVANMEIIFVGGGVPGGRCPLRSIRRHILLHPTQLEGATGAGGYHIGIEAARQLQCNLLLHIFITSKCPNKFFRFIDGA